MSDQISISDIQPLLRFAEECERSGTARLYQIQWWVRYRNENGLMDSGAVIEKRANPRSKRARLFVNVPRFTHWLATNSAA